jgi:hypothetical protein
MKNRVTINRNPSLTVRPFAAVQPLVEVSTEWKKEQAAIARRKAQREDVLYRAAQAQVVLSTVLVLKKIPQGKFEQLSRELFKD